MGPCEKCGKPPEGVFGLHSYCEHCGKNLCDDCMMKGWCADGSDNKHSAYTDDEEISAKGDSENG